MAKKSKEAGPNPSSVPNRDIIQRLNFLYQASAYLHGLASQDGIDPDETEVSNDNGMKRERSKKNESAIVDENETPKRTRNKGRVNTGDLARSYVKSMKIIGQKTIVRMDPSVKRTLCKGCNSLLIPGVTAQVRVKQLSSHGHAVLYTCSHCMHRRQIPAPPILHGASSSSALPPAIDDQNKKNQIEGQQSDHDAEMLDMSANESPKKPEKEQVRFKRKKKPIKPRPIPFFEREGHVLFVGNEVVAAASEAS